ncbi:MAG: hypothetical protein RLZZ612_423, partial [Pseudomonadota bacterium]
CGPRQRDFAQAKSRLRSGQVQQSGAMEVKANAQLGIHQGGVAEHAKGACEVSRKSGNGRVEKRTTLLTNTEVSAFAVLPLEEAGERLLCHVVALGDAGDRVAGLDGDGVVAAVVGQGCGGVEDGGFVWGVGCARVGVDHPTACACGIGEVIGVVKFPRCNDDDLTMVLHRL